MPHNYDFLNSNHVDPVYNIDAYHKEIKYRLQIANQLAHKFLSKSKDKRKINYDKTAKPQSLLKDDLVLIEINERHKLEPFYKGPYKVKSIQEPNVIVIDDKNKEKLIHKDKVKKFHTYFYYRFIS